jgi:hypothetical protein
MVRGNLWSVRLAAVAMLLAATSWSEAADQGGAGLLPFGQKTIALKPSIIFVKASFLAGEIDGLKVVEQVDRGSGVVVGAPMLTGTLNVSNESKDHAARLLGGKIAYLDASGKPIPADNTSFTFTEIPTNRLDPGMQTSQVIEVPFPSAALAPHTLGEISVELTFIPIAYQQDTVNVPVHLGG